MITKKQTNRKAAQRSKEYADTLIYKGGLTVGRSQPNNQWLTTGEGHKEGLNYHITNGIGEGRRADVTD